MTFEGETIHFFKPQIFHEARMDRILAKQYLLTGYLELLLNQNFFGSDKKVSARLITPEDPRQRGSQLSIMFSENIQEVYLKMEQEGIVVSRVKLTIFVSKRI